MEVPPQGCIYLVKINEEVFKVYQEKVTGQELLEAAGFKHPNCHRLFQVFCGYDQSHQVDLNQTIDLTQYGLERFYTQEVEETSFYLDDEKYEVVEKVLTPNQILDKAGLDPEKYYLMAIENGDQHSYENCPNEEINLCRLSQFISIFKGSTQVA